MAKSAHVMKRSILIVDDEVHVREGLAEILEQEGFHVETAMNGKEALAIVVNKRFDLMISDMKMPEMDGMELLDSLQASNPELRVIMVTAFGDVQTYLNAMQLGAYEYINKPIKLPELKRVIATIMDQT